MFRAPTDFALYIHWPFCISKCPYCDFNSHVRSEVDQSAWCAALLRDLDYEALRLSELGEDFRLVSIFFGGGTPSLMPPSTVAALIEAARHHWTWADDVEITLEANPSSVEAANFADLALAGVNRVSLGLQALDDEALGFLGRAHSVSEALAALQVAQNHFSRTNIDLIYARPDQKLGDWESELARALALGTDHLSLYQLTIEPGTRFETMVRQKDFVPVDPDFGADLYELTGAMTLAAGRPAYEISNHAVPGAESRHNLTYWRYGTYAGVGPGAHGRRGGLATVRHRKPENWMAATLRNGHGNQSETLLAPEEQAREALLMGLRLAEGIDLALITTRTGLGLDILIDETACARLEVQNLLSRQGSRLTVTTAGMLLLDAILPEIVSV
jgi:putative oxygen-independent coproporphyrinogen III oxidase